MNDKPGLYHAYLLRLWLVEQDEQWVWRISLENIHTGVRRGFVSMDALTVYLNDLGQTGRHVTHMKSPNDE